MRHLAPDGPFECLLDANACTILWEPPRPVATARVAAPADLQVFDGRTLSFFTTEPVEALEWPEGAAYALLPRSLPGGGSFRMTFHAATGRWYPI